MIVFGLWYWEFDRGGPVARANATHMYPDFQFVQMASPQLAPPDWEPAFGDYLYLSFTNAAAFSPTDVMPLSRWAKMGMTAQAAISIVTVALVVARAMQHPAVKSGHGGQRLRHRRGCFQAGEVISVAARAGPTRPSAPWWW